MSKTAELIETIEKYISKQDKKNCKPCDEKKDCKECKECDCPDFADCIIAAKRCTDKVPELNDLVNVVYLDIPNFVTPNTTITLAAGPVGAGIPYTFPAINGYVALPDDKCLSEIRLAFPIEYALPKLVDPLANKVFGNGRIIYTLNLNVLSGSRVEDPFLLNSLLTTDAVNPDCLCDNRKVVTYTYVVTLIYSAALPAGGAITLPASNLINITVTLVNSGQTVNANPNLESFSLQVLPSSTSGTVGAFNLTATTAVSPNPNDEDEPQIPAVGEVAGMAATFYTPTNDSAALAYNELIAGLTGINPVAYNVPITTDTTVAFGGNFVALLPGGPTTPPEAILPVTGGDVPIVRFGYLVSFVRSRRFKGFVATTLSAVGF